MDRSFTYDGANQYCINQGGRLFEPRSELTNKAVYDKSVEVFGSTRKTWIGINDIDTEGEFVFQSSGEQIIFTFFSTGNANTNSENCVQLGFSSPYEYWFDRPCDESQYSICEYGEYKYIQHFLSI